MLTLRFQQFLLPLLIATVALGRHVLPIRLDILSRQHPTAHLRLYRNLEHLGRDLIAQLVHQPATYRARPRTMNYLRQLLHRLVVQAYLQLHQIRRLELNLIIVKTFICI
jgi:hypothetical protein